MRIYKIKFCRNWKRKQVTPFINADKRMRWIEEFFNSIFDNCEEIEVLSREIKDSLGNNVLSLKGLKVGTDGQRIPQIVSCGKGNRKW
jgi:hypothetical protein